MWVVRVHGLAYGKEPKSSSHQHLELSFPGCVVLAPFAGVRDARFRRSVDFFREPPKYLLAQIPKLVA